MATVIKSIPTLSGEAAERFIELLESSKDEGTTVISADMRASISRMMERSRNFKIKTATE